MLNNFKAVMNTRWVGVLGGVCKIIPPPVDPPNNEPDTQANQAEGATTATATSHPAWTHAIVVKEEFVEYARIDKSNVIFSHILQNMSVCLCATVHSRRPLA